MVEARTSIVVDGRGLSGSSAGRGIGTYLRGVLPFLAQDASLDLTVLATSRDLAPAGSRFVKSVRVAPGRWQDREHDLLLPLDVRRARGAQVMLSPALDPPRTSHLPWVQTLHDVIPLDLDSGFTEERERWLRYAARFRQAAHILAVSQHCADLAVDLLQVDASQISVALHGVDPVFRARAAMPRADVPPYLLYVGEYDARKGYAEAFDVIGRVADAGLPHVLKVAGFIAPWTRTEIERLVAQSPHPERIVLLDHVHHTKELPALLRDADLLTVTSRYEGFGLPAAEAMACGTPVVSFSNTSLTEVVADGGILVKDGDTEAFADVVVSLLRDESARTALAAQGLLRSEEFTWERSAALHRAALVGAVSA